MFYLVSPTNISVLSYTNIEIKIRHLMMVLSAIPDIEITCTDSSECFDDNKAYLHGRLAEEPNPKVRRIIKKDIDFLDNMSGGDGHGQAVPVYCKAEEPEGEADFRYGQPDRKGHLRAGLRGTAA